MRLKYSLYRFHFIMDQISPRISQFRLNSIDLIHQFKQEFLYCIYLNDSEHRKDNIDYENTNSGIWQSRSSWKVSLKQDKKNTKFATLNSVTSFIARKNTTKMFAVTVHAKPFSNITWAVFFAVVTVAGSLWVFFTMWKFPFSTWKMFFWLKYYFILLLLHFNVLNVQELPS